jgi:hypothetical protein
MLVVAFLAATSDCGWCHPGYDNGPAQGLPETKVGTFTQALYDEAKKDGWTVISMKNDWKRIFAFE